MNGELRSTGLLSVAHPPSIVMESNFRYQIVILAPLNILIELLSGIMWRLHHKRRASDRRYLGVG